MIAYVSKLCILLREMMKMNLHIEVPRRECVFKNDIHKVAFNAGSESTSS